MDRPIEHRTILRHKHIPYIIGGVVAIVLTLFVVLGSNLRILIVNQETITVDTVRNDTFNDYISVNGTLVPISIVQLSPLESGVITQRVAEEGAIVKRGDVILRLSNPQLNISILESEASLAEKENFLRNTRVQMEQEKLSLRQERLQTALDVKRKKREWEQKQSLYNQKLIPKDEYIKAQEDYSLAVEQDSLIIQRQVQDSIFRLAQVHNMELNLNSMERNMSLVRQRIENLNICSPIDGELGMLDASLGQAVTSGQKLGQINDLSSFKIEALIDEHYIDRVRTKLEGTFTKGQKRYTFTVSKVFPEVRNGKFRTWMTFTGERPENMRSGQTYYLSLELSQAQKCTIIPKGSFFETTAGAWIFVLTNNNTALRREIQIGRQNPQYYEVIHGLKPGERVITSTYINYKDKEELKIR